MYLRSQYKTLLARLSKPPHSLIIVAGPRQVGKTTLVRDTLEHKWSLPDGVTAPSYYSLDVPVPVDELNPDSTMGGRVKFPDRDWLVSVWEKARTEAKKPGRSVPHILVLDDIQELYQWARIVKNLWDADRCDRIPLHVILVVSSPLEALEGLHNLAGRYEAIHLPHWSFEEMNGLCGLSLSQYLYYGGYPYIKHHLSDADSMRWSQYVEDNFIDCGIQWDSMMMRQVEFPWMMQQIYELGCWHSGQIVSKNDLKGELKESTMTTYIEMLRQLGWVKGVKKYAREEERDRSSDPKMLVLNTALMSAQKRYTFERAQADRSYWGQLVTSAVGTHLHNAGGEQTRVFYWRGGGHEVDFVVEQGDQCLAVEVNGSKGLDAFAKEYPGSGRLAIGSAGVPLEHFLRSDTDDWFEWGGRSDRTIQATR